KINVMSMIWTWDRVVSARHRYLASRMGIKKYIDAYIKSRILKGTLDSFLIDSYRILLDLADTYHVVNPSECDTPILIP
ncbi:MAG: hypothetical protein MHPSP_004782, partial [Paramarteilia canceri]